MPDALPFFNLHRHGFVRVAVAIPEVRIADPVFNARQTAELAREAERRRASLVAFPELGLSAYTCDDLFQQQALLDGCRGGLAELLRATRTLPIALVVGLPLHVDGLLFNCAAVCQRGQLLGVVPKSYLPNYREFYERRHFTPGFQSRTSSIDLCGQRDVPFGNTLLFQAEGRRDFAFHVEICEDIWVPIAPSSFAALAGATVLVNLSASNVTLGKDEYRRSLVSGQSARCIAAYVYSAAGQGESTTDMAWDGHGMIFENGTALAQTERFAYGAQLCTGDVDLDRLVQDRMRQTTFGDSIADHRDRVAAFRTVPFRFEPPRDAWLPLARRYERFPYVPSDAASRDLRCAEVYDIQVQALVTRLRATRIDRPVIGVSGGLDSTQALMVCARAMDVMGLPRASILGVTMPGFATSTRTLDQARRLMRACGCESLEIDIRPGCLEILRNIGHPFAQGKPVYDLTFENVQAGERTSNLFRLANYRGGLVVGTGDLSELALGWNTYGVGDQMAHYNVNASVPKTLVRYLIDWVAENAHFGDEASEVLRAVLATDISPELVPGEEGEQPTQRSEDTVGPYELQDFHLYYALRFGYLPSKIAFLAWSAWHDREAGSWPGGLVARNEYSIATVKRWLRVFLDRFFRQSQYKRSAMPNAPKVGSGGSLSPRSEWRAPADGNALIWLSDLDAVPDEEPVPAKARAVAREPSRA